MSAALLPGERELWTGAPVRFPVFRSGDLLVVPFTFAWWGFALFWECSVVAVGAPVFMLVWGSIFVLVGAHLAVGRLVVRWLRLRATRYTVTTRRVVVTSVALGVSREESRYLRDLEPPVLTEAANGVGTIRFGANDFDLSVLFRYRYPAALRSVELRAIPNARLVRDIIASHRA